MTPRRRVVAIILCAPVILIAVFVVLAGRVAGDALINLSWGLDG